MIKVIKILSKFQHLLMIIVLLLNCKKVNAEDSLKLKKVKVLPVPTFGYSPETSTHVGAVALFTLNFYQDGITRTSNAKVEFNYTWNKQIIAEAQWNYFFREEKWLTRGQLHVSKYPDLYFGIGDNTPDEDELKFESNRVIVEVDALNRIKKNFFVGVGLRYLNYSNLSFFDNTNPYTELKDDSNIGVKLILLRDSRNNILNASTGSYAEFLSTHNTSDGYYSLLSFDFRKYYEMKYNQSHVVAGRFYTSFVFGNPTFYDYSLIGGDKYARGYFYGRFREQHFTTLQLEYRFKLFWRIGLAGFGGLSMIYKDFAAINSKTFKPNGGLGLRFLVDKKENTNLRLDYAIGTNGQDGFYVTFGESF